MLSRADEARFTAGFPAIKKCFTFCEALTDGDIAWCRLKG